MNKNRSDEKEGRRGLTYRDPDHEDPQRPQPRIYLQTTPAEPVLGVARHQVSVPVPVPGVGIVPLHHQQTHWRSLAKEKKVQVRSRRVKTRASAHGHGRRSPCRTVLVRRRIGLGGEG